MKNSTIALIALLALGLPALPGRAQISITEVGTTSGGTMPGSASDYIFFNHSNYPGYPSSGQSTDNGTSYSQLSSFFISGGVNGVDGTGSYATITTPAGYTVLTGDLQASPSIAFALEPGQGTVDTNLNSSFNYNDFNVYLMYSNTGGTFTDTVISLDARSSVQNPAFGTNDVSVTDNTTGSTTAKYLEFNVKGLATAISLGYSPDLVVSANIPGGGVGYIGAVSFQSVTEVPEPSTYAMMLAGLAMLGFVARRKGALNK